MLVKQLIQYSHIVDLKQQSHNSLTSVLLTTLLITVLDKLLLSLQSPDNLHHRSQSMQTMHHVTPQQLKPVAIYHQLKASKPIGFTHYLMIKTPHKSATNLEEQVSFKVLLNTGASSKLFNSQRCLSTQN